MKFLSENWNKLRTVYFPNTNTTIERRNKSQGVKLQNQSEIVIKLVDSVCVLSGGIFSHEALLKLSCFSTFLDL